VKFLKTLLCLFQRQTCIAQEWLQVNCQNSSERSVASRFAWTIHGLSCLGRDVGGLSQDPKPKSITEL